MAKKKYIIVVSYQIEKWSNRKKAMQFYMDCIRNTEGAERDRYTDIYFDLADGLDICGDIDSYEFLKESNLYFHFDNPEDTRDYGGKIWYPILHN